MCKRIFCSPSCSLCMLALWVAKIHWKRLLKATKSLIGLIHNYFQVTHTQRQFDWSFSYKDWICLWFCIDAVCRGICLSTFRSDFQLTQFPSIIFQRKMELHTEILFTISWYYLLSGISAHSLNNECTQICTKLSAVAPTNWIN